MSTHCTSLALLFFACSASAEILSTGAKTLQLTIPDEHRFLKVINLEAQDVPSSCAGGSFTYKVKNVPTIFKGTPTGKDKDPRTSDLILNRQVQSGTVQFAGLSKWSIDVRFNVTDPETFEVTLSATCVISMGITPEWYVLDSNAVKTETSVHARTSLTVRFDAPVLSGKYVFVQSVWWTAEDDTTGCTVARPAYHVLYTQPDIATPIIFRDSCVGCSSQTSTWYPMTGMQGRSFVAQFSTMDLTGCLNAPALKTGALVMIIDDAKGVVSPPPVPRTDVPLSGGVCAPIVTLLVAAIALVLA